MKLRIPAVLVLCTAACLAAGTGELKAGKADLRSAGPLAFGPEGVLFIGDSAGAAIFAVDTGDPSHPPGALSKSRASMRKSPLCSEPRPTRSRSVT
jgi:hypothetical protein